MSIFLTTAASRGESHTPIIGQSEVLHCTAGFYDHFNQRYVNEYNLQIYYDFSFSISADVLYGTKLHGWGKLKDESTLEFIQDIGFGRRAAFGTLSVDVSRTKAKLYIDQTKRIADLTCLIENL